MKKIIMIMSLILSVSVFAKDASPITTGDSSIKSEELHLMVRHLTEKELFVEADGWLILLQDASKKVYDIKRKIYLKNNDLIKIGTKDQNNSDVKKETKLLTENKDELLERLTLLRAERKNIVSDLDVVLLNINEKIGLDKEGKELDKVLPYRRYIDTVSGVTVEVTDIQSAWKTIYEWVMSEEGGLYWLMNIFKFLSIMFISLFISKLFSKASRKALTLSRSSSELLNDFIANIIHKLVMLIGLLVALSALDVNVAPIMAMLGAAGFVVAFALQSTLSNFASGLMIMLYRPFDIDDVIDVAGVVGTVKSMTLVTTSVMTGDNRMMIIPNNTIWGSIITNVTHSDNRRVDMVFGIGYNDDIDKAQNILKDILEKHPLVLKEPGALVELNELADSSVNFIVRPWALTSNYWPVYWEVTKEVKKRFDEEKISIPFPQQDIHIITDKSEK